MLSIDDRISKIIKGATGVSVEEIKAILINEGYPKSEVDLVPWVII